MKESRDLPTFDRIFDLYFLDLEALGAGLKKALGPEDPRMREMLDKLMAQDGLELDELTELMLRGEGADMEMAIRGQGQAAGLERLMYFLQIGYFSRRIYDKFDWEAIERDLVPHHADARGEGAGSRPARAHPQLPRPAPRGLPAHDPPARGARAGAPRLP